MKALWQCNSLTGYMSLGNNRCKVMLFYSKREDAKTGVGLAQATVQLFDIKIQTTALR